MVLAPTSIDLWLATQMAEFMKLHPWLDSAVNSAIRHNILGGFWFGAALFLCWLQAARTGRREIQLRVLTILVGSALAILLTLIAGTIISWPPPARYLGLSSFFPDYLRDNPNTNCFPSQSTALFGSVAAGVYSLHRGFGSVLWILVIAFVAFPRMYVGGHYLTDVVVGAGIALTGYAISRRFFEARGTAKVEHFLAERPLLWLFTEFVVFAWIFQVTVEFREVVWATGVVKSLIS